MNINCSKIEEYHAPPFFKPQILPTAKEVVPAFLYFMKQTVANPITYTPIETSRPSLGNLFARFLSDD